MGKVSEKLKAVAAAVAAIEKQFGKGAIMQLGRDGEVAPVAIIPSGSVGPRPGAGRGRLSARAGRRGLRERVVREDDPRPPRHRPGAGPGRRRGVRRRRARARRHLRAQARGADRGSPGLPAGHRRAGAGDHRAAGPERRGGPGRRGLGRRARAPGGDRRRDGRRAHGRPGAAHEPGAPQAHRRGQQERDGHLLHQPDPHEDRRGLRQPGDDHRRQRAQVLRLGADGDPPARQPQGRRRRSSARGPG